MLTGRWIISHRRSWITVYVLCCNAQSNRIVIVSHVWSFFYQLPSYNLFTQHVICLCGGTPLVNCGPRSSFFYCYNHLLQIPVYFCNYCFIYFTANISFHTIRLILCFQQTGEIDNLTERWGKVFWLCCVQVPRCC